MAQTTEQTTATDTTHGGKKRAGKYLTFSLSDEEYGLPVLKVKEILGLMPINTIPQTPAAIRGVINLRDKVIPILDLRRRFDMPENEETDKTCIIVVEGQKTNLETCWEVKKCGKTACPAYGSSDHRCWMVSGTHCRDEIQGSFYEKREACTKCNFFQAMQQKQLVFIMGIVVDAVQEVATFKEEEIEDAPAMSGNIDLSYVRGIAKREGAVKILLDVDKVLQGNTI